MNRTSMTPVFVALEADHHRLGEPQLPFRCRSRLGEQQNVDYLAATEQSH